MMQIFTSISAIVFGKIVIRKAVKHSLKEKACRRLCHGLEVYCTKGDEPVVLGAVKEVAGFCGDDWAAYRKFIKTLVISEGMATCLLIPQRAIIIQHSDRTRMTSKTELAGWLIADYERIRLLQKYSCRMICWSGTAAEIAAKGALFTRKQYLVSCEE